MTNERWVWRLTLLYSERVYEVLRRAQARCLGCPLYRGTILKALHALRKVLEGPQYTLEQRQANIEQLNQVTATAFSINGSHAQQEPDKPQISTLQVQARAERKGITLEQARREIEWQSRNRVLIGAKQ